MTTLDKYREWLKRQILTALDKGNEEAAKNMQKKLDDYECPACQDMKAFFDPQQGHPSEQGGFPCTTCRG